MINLPNGIDNETIRANLKVHSVYQEGIPNAEGSVDYVWMIDYSPGTDPSLARILAKVEDVSPESRANGRRSRVDDPNSAIGLMKRRSWDAMKPHIDAAKLGQELVVNGHALAVWPGIDQRKAEIFRQFGIRTVEELTTMPESMVIAISSKLPATRHYVKQAHQFLEAQESSAAAAAITERDREIETLKLANTDMSEQMTEMRKMMERILTAQAQPEEPRKRRRANGEADLVTEDAS